MKKWKLIGVVAKDSNVVVWTGGQLPEDDPAWGAQAFVAGAAQMIVGNHAAGTGGLQVEALSGPDGVTVHVRPAPAEKKR